MFNTLSIRQYLVEMYEYSYRTVIGGVHYKYSYVYTSTQY